MVFFHIIAAYANDFICGVNGELPWKCPEDMEHFREVTRRVTKRVAGASLSGVAGAGMDANEDIEWEMHNAVIMGYRTYQSIGKYLLGRYNFVIDRDCEAVAEGFVFDPETWNYHVKSLGDALRILHENYQVGLYIQNAFLIGGGALYTEFFRDYMYDYYIQNMYITRIAQKVDLSGVADDQVTRFPFMEAFRKSVRVNNVDGAGVSCDDIYNDCWILRSVRKSTDTGNEYRIYNGIDVLGYKFYADEREYLQLIYDVMKEGVRCEDRTGVGTVSKFGTQIRFSLRDGTLPLLTTKKMFTRGVVEELLWFLRGETDSKILEEKGVGIWKGNTSREALDRMGLTKYTEGEGGPIYGHQFRRFGGKWEIDNGSGKMRVLSDGVDQVEEVIRLLREEPNSRRIIINLWNPVDLGDMALPPCHMVYQFRVYNGKLSCSMYQRSCDTFLGLPFNICSTALMTYIFGKLSGLIPDEIVISIGDAHIYTNHIEQVKTQLKRSPLCFPKVKIADRGQKCVEDFRADDFMVLGYESHPAIAGQMAV